MIHLRIGAAATAFLCLAAGAAWAQSTTPSAPSPSTNLDAKPGTLSDKLSDTNGIIKPTDNVDPAMPKAAPQTGTMPVIKPGQVPSQSGTGSGADKSGLY